MALKITKEIQARMRLRAAMDEAGELVLAVHASAVYGTPVNKAAGEHTCSVRYENTPPALVAKLKGVLEEIRAYAEAHVATDLMRAITVARETGLRLGEIKEEEV
jgi:hypothetical protein